MPDLNVLSEKAHTPSQTESQDQNPARSVTRPKIARSVIAKIKTATDAFNNNKNARPGERMRAFVAALKDHEGIPQNVDNRTASEGESHGESEEDLSLSDASKRFMRVMNLPSLFTRIWAAHSEEKPSQEQIQMYVREQNYTLLSTLLGNDTMDKIERGDPNIDIGQAIAGRIAEIRTNQLKHNAKYIFHQYLGDVNEGTVYALRRLEKALLSDKSTREAAKMLRQLRKDNDLTLPRYAWSYREQLAGALEGTKVGQKVIGGIDKAAQKILDKVGVALGMGK